MSLFRRTVVLVNAYPTGNHPGLLDILIVQPSPLNIHLLPDNAEVKGHIQFKERASDSSTVKLPAPSVGLINAAIHTVTPQTHPNLAFHLLIEHLSSEMPAGVVPDRVSGPTRG